MRKKCTTLLAALLALTLLLSACGQSNSSSGQEEGEESASPFTITVCATAPQDTLDPARSTAAGGETILFHLFENLMRWEDDGSGYAALAPGQAESYTVETDYAGNATYTFTLRQGLRWSDGKSVTAEDFVTAWQRLADPANDLPHRELMSVVAGYDQVQETGDVTLLSVSAPDESTFAVTLNGSCAYFLEEVCACAYTMPVRQDLLSDSGWGSSAAGTVTNGAYIATYLGANLITLERSETYYDAAQVGPDILRFVSATDSEADYGNYLSGEINLIQDLPVSVLRDLTDSGAWTPEAITSTYGVLLNNQQPPFDDPNIRRAFQLAVDTQAVVDILGDLTSRAASGLVPYGVTDYGERGGEDEIEEEPALPDPNAEPVPEEPSVYWDFRAHSLEKVTVPSDSDYAGSCLQAQALMAQAGYAGGGGFPVVEYIYVESDANRAIARALQSMWQAQLGVTVTARGLSQEEFDAMLLPAGDGEASEEEAEASAPSFQLAGMEFSAAYSDAEALLSRWHSASADNLAGYQSEAFDILLDAAQAAVSPDARDAYLHDAEAILLADAPVIPVCYQGASYQLAEGLTGLYRAPDGVYFLFAVKAEADLS